MRRGHPSNRPMLRTRNIALLRAIAPSLVAIAAAACDSAVGPTQRSGLSIRGEPGLADSVSAPPARIIVQVRDRSLVAMPGVQVAFLYGPVVPSESRAWFVYYVRPSGPPTPGAVIDTTDGSGLAEAQLWHATAAGAQYLRVEARPPGHPERLLYVDSVLVRTGRGARGGRAWTRRCWAHD